MLKLDRRKDPRYFQLLYEVLIAFNRAGNLRREKCGEERKIDKIANRLAAFVDVADVVNELKNKK